MTVQRCAASGVRLWAVSRGYDLVGNSSTNDQSVYDPVVDRKLKGSSYRTADASFSSICHVRCGRSVVQLL